MNMVNDALVRPNDPITRKEAAIWTSRFIARHNANQSPSRPLPHVTAFADVPKDSSEWSDISGATGVFNGVEIGEARMFEADSPLTRGEAAKVAVMLNALLVPSTAWIY